MLQMARVTLRRHQKARVHYNFQFFSEREVIDCLRIEGKSIFTEGVDRNLRIYLSIVGLLDFCFIQ
jgi:hypothetical protein